MKDLKARGEKMERVRADGDVPVNYNNAAFGTTWAYNAAGYNQTTTDVQRDHVTTEDWGGDADRCFFSRVEFAAVQRELKA